MRLSSVAQEAHSPGAFAVTTSTPAVLPVVTVRPSHNTEVATDLAIVVDAAVAGDRAATDRLLALVQPLVLRYCRGRIGRQCGSRRQPEDCCRCEQKFHSVDPSCFCKAEFLRDNAFY